LGFEDLYKIGIDQVAFLDLRHGIPHLFPGLTGQVNYPSYVSINRKAIEQIRFSYSGIESCKLSIILYGGI
jgi:hypothetical protein